MEGEAEAELRKLHDAVYDQALVWVNSLKPEQKERIVGHFGPMPEKDSDLQVGLSRTLSVTGCVCVMGENVPVESVGNMPPHTRALIRGNVTLAQFYPQFCKAPCRQ